MANLKSPPLFLDEALTAKLAGDRPAYGRGVARLPLKGKLVDRPKGGRDG